MTDDEKDTRAARKILLSIGVLLTMWILGAVLMLVGIMPSFGAAADGVGWGHAAIYAFFLSSTLMLAFAFAGDGGMFGEIGFMLVGFLVVFLASWPFIAIIF